MIRLSEPFVDELIAVLTAGLASRGTAIAAATPVLEMAPVASIVFGEHDDPMTPAVTLFPDTSPLIHDGYEALTFRHRIKVQVHVTHVDSEAITRLIGRYAAAVIQTFMDARVAGTFTFPFQLSTEQGADLDWGPTWRNGATFQRDVLFEVIANADDSRT